jgi:hypothetical protein
MITYTVKTKAENPSESVILKTGGEVEFTMNNIEADIAYLEKTKKELTAQMSLEDAKMKNVLRTHPHIEQVSEEDRVATYLYQQSFAFTKVAKSKLEQIENQLKEYADEKVEIIKQTGLVIEPANQPQANV